MTDSEGIRLLTADDIWDADDIQEQTIEVPEWGGSVRVRALSLAQIARIAQKSIKTNAQGQTETSRELSVMMTLHEGMVEPKLSLEDCRRRLGGKSAAAVTRIVQAINAMGATPEAIDEADKSLWSEPDAAISVPVGARIEDDASPIDTGNGRH